MLLFAFYAEAQTGVKVAAEEEVEVPKSTHSAKKATLYSTFLPGLGQAYNKKYWKIPIVYAGLGTTIYFIYWNTDQYNIYKEAFDLRMAGGTDIYSGIYSEQNLITLQNYYRNNRDLSIILTVLIYGLNILDANIDAHLFDYDVSENISMRFEPALIQNTGFGFGGMNYGMKMTLQLK